MATTRAEREFYQLSGRVGERVKQLVTINDKYEFLKEIEKFIKEVKSSKDYTQALSFMPARIGDLFAHAALQDNSPAIKFILKIPGFHPSYDSLLKNRDFETQKKVVAQLARNELLPHTKIQKLTLADVIENGDFGLVEILLNYGLDKFHDKSYPLVSNQIFKSTIEKNNPKYIKLLFEAGMDFKGTYRLYPITGGCYFVNFVGFAVNGGHELAIKELIRQGAGLPGQLLFFKGYNVEKACNVLLEPLRAGLNPNAKVRSYEPNGEIEDRTILAFAIAHKHYELVKLAFESGGKTAHATVQKALEPLQKEKANEDTQRILNLFYKDGHLLEYHQDYIASLCKSDSVLISSALASHSPIIKDLHTPIIEYAQPMPEEALAEAKTKQQSLVSSLKRHFKPEEEMEGLPKHFQEFVNTLDQYVRDDKEVDKLIGPHVIPQDKVVELLLTAVTNYVATYTKERFHEEQKRAKKKWIKGSYPLPMDQFRKSPFFKDLEKIAGAEAISKAFEKGVEDFSAEDNSENETVDEKKRSSPFTTPASQEAASSPNSIASLPPVVVTSQGEEKQIKERDLIADSFAKIEVFSSVSGSVQLQTWRESNQSGAFVQVHPEEPNTVCLVLHHANESGGGQSYKFNFTFMANDNWVMWSNNNSPTSYYPLEQERGDMQTQKAQDKLFAAIKKQLSVVSGQCGFEQEPPLSFPQETNEVLIALKKL